MRIKWIQYSFPILLDGISELLLGNQYSPEHLSGFIVDKIDSKRIEASYIEQINSVSIILDPFGNEIETPVISYYTCKFIIDHESRLICFVDPPRSLKNFIAKINMLVGFGCVFEDIIINPLSWAKNFSRDYGPVTITEIVTSGIRTGYGGVANISLSNSNGAIPDFEQVVSNKHHNINSVKFKNHNHLYSGYICEFSQLASCKLRDGANARFVVQIAESLKQTMKDNLRKN